MRLAYSCLPAGALYDGKLFVVSPNDADSADAMRVYDFERQEWTFLELPERPPAGIEVLLAVYKGCLIQLGGDPTFPRLSFVMHASHGRHSSWVSLFLTAFNVVSSLYLVE